MRGAGTVRPSAEVDIAPQVGGRVVGWTRVSSAVVTSIRADPVPARGGRLRTRRARGASRLAVREVALLEAREDAAIAQAEYERYVARQAENAPAKPNPLTLHIPQLKAAEAALAREEAALAQARLALSRTKVTAPFDGVVHDESVDVGQLVTPGQSVGRLFSADAVEVVVALSRCGRGVVPRLWQYEGETPRVVAVVFAEYGDVAYAWRGYVGPGGRIPRCRDRTIDVIVHVPDPFAPGTPAGSAASRDTNPPLLRGQIRGGGHRGVGACRLLPGAPCGVAGGR